MTVKHFQHDKTKDLLSINNIRSLALDAIEAANSGHPGMALDAAPIMYQLYSRHMKYNPADPDWFNRDRFVLSAGHASALMYSILYTFGFDLPKEELAKFRQLNSKTPGHPEYGVTPGVDASTGPLGQGIAMAVGMAIAEANLAARYNKEGHEIIDHYTYVLSGDGCLMEGLASEACSLAGTLGLGKLILIYDRNKISIEGSTEIAFDEKVNQRFEAYGWQVLTIADGNDPELINSALNFAKAEKRKPTIIIANTTIGYASPLAGSEKTHGSPLGPDNTAKTKEALGLDPAMPPFTFDQSVVDYLAPLKKDLQALEDKWNNDYAEYKKAYPAEAEELEDMLNRSPKALEKVKEELLKVKQEDKIATRASASELLQIIAKHMPAIIGGSADLGPSNKSVMKELEYMSKENYAGRNIHYGVREFAMAGISNGIALHGGLHPFCATFFVFSDYMKAAMRMSAMCELPVTYYLTHDSFHVGEDGPTHQPVEQLAGLRSIPGLTVYRPASTEEASRAWVYALESGKPTVLVLSRQGLEPVKAENVDFNGAAKGAYIVKKESSGLDILLIAAGSELNLALEAAAELEAQNISTRVVSMPSMEVFLEQSESYREEILPAACEKRISVEAGSAMPWYRFTGLKGKNMAIDHFGLSGKGGDLQKEFNFTSERLVEMAKELKDE